jgi:hypothetical protein
MLPASAAIGGGTVVGAGLCERARSKSSCDFAYNRGDSSSDSTIRRVETMTTNASRRTVGVSRRRERRARV